MQILWPIHQLRTTVVRNWHSLGPRAIAKLSSPRKYAQRTPMTIDLVYINLLVQQHWPVMSLVVRRVRSSLRLPLGWPRDRSRREVRYRICLHCCVKSVECLCKFCLRGDLCGDITRSFFHVGLSRGRSNTVFPMQGS